MTGSYLTTGNILGVSKEFVVPYNSEATLHWYKSFWALLLPVSVHGRVSDIWRSYIAQAIFPLIGLSLGYIERPLVVKYHSAGQSPFEEFQSEQDLFTKAHHLIKWINRAHIDKPGYLDLPDVIESVWIDLYERGFMGMEDISLIQEWLQVLVEIGYKFPQLISHRSNSSFSACSSSRVTAEEIFNKINLTNVLVDASVLKHHKSSKMTQCPVTKIAFASGDWHYAVIDDFTTVVTRLNHTVVRFGAKALSKYYKEISRRKGVKIVGARVSDAFKPNRELIYTNDMAKENYMY